MGSSVKFLPDYAEGESKTGYALHKVGMDEIFISRIDLEENTVITEQSAFVSLKRSKGIHMSRIIGILEDYSGEPIEIDDEMMDKIITSHRAESAYWECKWQTLINIDDINTLLVDFKLEAKALKNNIDWFLTTKLPYASVCPCAHEMCKVENDGVPHMQRAVASITGQIANTTDLPEFSSELITKVIGVVDIIPKPFMKREHELEWCQRASRKNLFVEDAAREIAKAIHPCFENAVVACKHYESIHRHNVIAIHRKGEGLL